MTKILVVLMSLVNFGCSVFGDRSVEELKYDLVKKEKSYEIRFYPEHIIAQVVVDKDNNAENRAFRILANYIFGNNKSKSKIAMTAPVISNENNVSEKINMTAPVFMESLESQKLVMSFSMPSTYSMENLPEPLDQQVKLLKVSEQYRKFSAWHPELGTRSS
jgi:hypothetical protein